MKFLFNLGAVAGAFTGATLLAPYTGIPETLLGLFFNGVAVCWLAGDVATFCNNGESHD